jgi:hypothetical protein
MTRYPKPEPITREWAGRLRQAALDVTGRSLIGVRYRFPTETRWPQGYARGQLDEVDMAITADFAGGATLLISWAMNGFAEGIDAEAGPTETFAVVADRQCEFDVGESGPWAGLRGDMLAGISAAWQLRSEYASGETAWAVRLLFATGRAVVIALGEMRNGAVEYQPDGLVVFFDEGQADAYRGEYESQGGGVPKPWQPVAVRAGNHAT